MTSPINQIGYGNVQKVGFNPFQGGGASGGVGQKPQDPNQHLDQTMLADKKAGFEVGLGGTNDPVDANGKKPTICFAA